MGFVFVCESCGKRLTVPPSLYDKKVRGRVVTIACRGCGAPIRIDATLPPPPVAERGAEGGAASGAGAPEIPKAGRLPHDAASALAVSPVSRRLETPIPGSGQPSMPWGSDIDAAWDAESSASVPLALTRSPRRDPSEVAADEAARFAASIVADEGATHGLSDVEPYDSMPLPLGPEAKDSGSTRVSSSLPTKPDVFAGSPVEEGLFDAAPISHAIGPISTRPPIAKIGRYLLFDKFASGGMSTVHIGRLDGAGGFSRVVAIKRLLPHLVKNEEFAEMLLNEARLAARVRHPNVVPTLDVVASKGEVLLVLEYVHGESLSALCRAQAKRAELIPLSIVANVMLGVLEGLHAVHEATDEKGRSLGLVHRDVSPPNVIVGVDGMSRVLDFGIVKALERIEETGPNRLKGKTGYMAPEQVRGERVTRASDIFAAGIVLWELLALRRFAAGATDKERIDKIASGIYSRPSEFRPELGDVIDEVVMKALELEPEERYATAREFAMALAAVAEAASAGVVADWVQRLAEPTLTERSRLLAQVENWDDGRPEIELNSTPFAVERDVLALAGATATPLAAAAASTAPALKQRKSSKQPRKAGASADSLPAPARPAPTPTASKSWWVILALLGIGVAILYWVSR